MKNRQAFTLIELLVVITILTILVMLTAKSMSWTADKDRVPMASNEIASMMMGARDRAIFRRKATGVRLILDQNGPTNIMGNPATVTSMLYVGTPEPFLGQCSIEWDPANPSTHLKKIRFWWAGTDLQPGISGADDDGDRTADNTTLELGTVGSDDIDQVASRTQWDAYEQLGLLDSGVSIKLRKAGSLPLNFKVVKVGTEWHLTSDFPPNNIANCLDLDFEVELFPAVLPDQEPRELPRGVCIDLESTLRAGGIPTPWHDPGTRRYLTMDIMFSPRGTGTHDWTGFGLCNLVIAEAADVEKTEYLNPLQGFYSLPDRPKAGQERVVSINPTTGRASVSQLFLDDADSDGVPDDPFRWAEEGKNAR